MNVCSVGNLKLYFAMQKAPQNKLIIRLHTESACEEGEGKSFADLEKTVTQSSMAIFRPV